VPQIADGVVAFKPSMVPSSNPNVTTIILGLALIVPASIGVMSGFPTILSHGPTLTILPAFFLASAHLWRVVVVLPTTLFFLWNRGLFHGESKVPKRTYILFFVATGLSVVYFIASLQWGITYEGIRYVRVVCAVNVVWAISLGMMLARSRSRSPSFRFSVILHWWLFAWLAWYAFPTLGELP
jgi:hypothetical protein